MNLLDNCIKQLRQLPYADMVELATVIWDELSEKAKDVDPLSVGKRDIADVLSGLKVGSVVQSEVTTAELRILREVFSRKRTVTISKEGTGYAMEVLTVPGSQVLGTDLRVMWPQMLDQITTLSVLKR